MGNYPTTPDLIHYNLRSSVARATTTVAVTDASGATAVAGPLLRLANTGAQVAYVRTGTAAAVAAVATAHPVFPGGDLIIVLGRLETHLACICAPGLSTTLVACPQTEG